jgi:hypothetical protein
LDRHRRRGSGRRIARLHLQCGWRLRHADEIAAANPTADGVTKYHREKRELTFKARLLTATAWLHATNPKQFVIPSMPVDWAEQILSLYKSRSTAVHEGRAVIDSPPVRSRQTAPAKSLPSSATLSIATALSLALQNPPATSKIKTTHPHPIPAPIPASIANELPANELSERSANLLAVHTRSSTNSWLLPRPVLPSRFWVIVVTCHRKA